MDKRDILQSIIDQGGDCEALHHRTQFYLCKTCPMSKLKQRPDGTYLSCWESLIVTEGNSGDDLYAEDIYLKKAIELLADIVIEDMLTEEPLAEETRRDSGQDN